MKTIRRRGLLGCFTHTETARSAAYADRVGSAELFENVVTSELNCRRQSVQGLP